MLTQERAVQDFRRDLALLLFARHALRLLTATAFVLGTAVLALRAGFGVERGPLLWGLLGLALALLPAVLLTWRALPAVPAVRALVDQRGSCGGLLVAGDETPLGDWEQHLPKVQQPRLHWRGRRSWGLSLAAAVFLLTAFLVPQRYVQSSAPTLDVRREAEKLERKIDVLKEETILDPIRAQALKLKLEQIKNDAKGDNPARTLEALDHLENLAQKSAKAAAESGARKTAQMNKAEAAAEALRKAGEKLTEKTQTKAMEELNKLTRKAAEENDLLRKKMKEEGLDGENDASEGFDPGKLQRLSRAMKGGKNDLKQRLERLKAEDLLNPEDLKDCDCDSEYDLEGLAEFLAQEGDNLSLEELLAKCQKPGRGGVDRGPGPAELTYGDESSDAGVKFKELVLPPPRVAELKKNRLVGVSPGDPDKGGGGASESGALAGAKSGGGSASTPVVLPRHRTAVQRYFDRPTK